MNNQKIGQVGCLIIILTMVLSTSLASKAQMVIASKADLVFVNDGKLVIVDEAGKIRETSIRGCSPTIGSSGNCIVYTAQELLSQVKTVAKIGRKRLGSTFRNIGLRLINLQTGAIAKLTENGQKVAISPNEKTIVYTDDLGQVKTVNIASHEYYQYGTGENPVWLDNQTIVFESNYVIMTAEIGKGSFPLITMDGISIAKYDGDIRRALSGALAGEKIYAQMSLRSCGIGKVSFGVTEISLKDGARFSLVVANNGGIVHSAEVADKFQKELVVDPDKYEAAFSSGSMLESTDQLFTAKYTPPLNGIKPGIGDASLVVACYGDISRVESLVYCRDKLYVATITESTRMVACGNGRVYYLANSQFDPVQLSMMNLSSSIAETDIIWLINDNKTKTRFSSGHELAVRK